MQLARQQVSLLQSVRQENASTGLDEGLLLSPNRVDQKPRVSKKPRLDLSHDYSTVRRRVEQYGRGVVKVPRAITRSPPPRLASVAPELPVRFVADKLVKDYQTVFESTLSILDWPSFRRQYDRVYRTNSLDDVPQDWIAVLFAVFSCGCLNDNMEDGKRFLGMASSMIDMGTDHPTVDHARYALLNHLILNEIGARSAAWTALGCAVRIAQSIGLHRSTIFTPGLSEEARSQLWHSIYVIDQYLFLTSCICCITETNSRSLFSLDYDCPAAIGDDDCDSSQLDSIVKRDNWGKDRSSSIESVQALISLVDTICLVSKVRKTSTTVATAPETIKAIDDQLRSYQIDFPSHHQLRSTEHIDPHTILPILYLQDIRLVLSRRGLSPLCTNEVRARAIATCYQISQDTAKYLSRTRSGLPGNPSTWRQSLQSAASSFLCLHTWRSILFLCFRGDYRSALVCAQVNNAIGNARPINISCGRYVDFFLRSLVPLLQDGDGRYLEQDEDMMAYLSGDLQSSVEHSWIWQKKDGDNAGSEANNIRQTLVSPYDDEAVDDSAVWEGIVETLQSLSESSRLKHTPKVKSGDGLSPPQKDVAFLSPRLDVNNTNNTVISPGGTNRISIADII